jgi:hypothetical protein
VLCQPKRQADSQTVDIGAFEVRVEGEVVVLDTAGGGEVVVVMVGEDGLSVLLVELESLVELEEVEEVEGDVISEVGVVDEVGGVGGIVVVGGAGVETGGVTGGVAEGCQKCRHQ